MQRKIHIGICPLIWSLWAISLYIMGAFKIINFEKEVKTMLILSSEKTVCIQDPPNQAESPE